MSSERVRVFKRLETDAEFKARLKAAGCTVFYSGEALDNEAWGYYRKQRRIVDDER